PLIVTDVLVGPNAGAKPVIVGCTLKLVIVSSEKAGVSTRIGPLPAPAGTVAWIVRLLNTRLVAAGAPPNRALAAPGKLLPEMITLVPARPWPGANPRITGSRKKLVLVVLVPRELITRIGPVVAPPGTVAWIWQTFVAEKSDALTPLKKTEV